MIGEIKGYVIADKKFEHTMKPEIGPLGVDLTKDYFDAMYLKMLPVIDIAVEGAVGNEYVIKGEGKESGTFLWYLDKRDAISGLIPYKLLHPEPSLEEITALVGRMIKGDFTDEDFDMVIKFTGRMSK